MELPTRIHGIMSHDELHFSVLMTEILHYGANFAVPDMGFKKNEISCSLSHSLVHIISTFPSLLSYYRNFHYNELVRMQIGSINIQRVHAHPSF